MRKEPFLLLAKLALILFPSIFTTGCTLYKARPLNKEDLNKALDLPDKKLLQEQSRLLSHPRLQPIHIDFCKPLTPKQLAIIAVINSPDLKALRAKEDVATAQVFDAGLLPDPQFSYSFANPLDSLPGLVRSYNYGLNFDIGALVSTWSKQAIADAKAQQVRYDVAWQEWLLANQVELLATRIFYLRQQLALINKAKDTAKKALNVSKTNLKKHDVKIDDFGIRQGIYLDFLDQSIKTERTLRKTILQLNQSLGFPPETQLAFDIPSKMDFPDLNAFEIYQKAQVNRLDLLALEAGYRSQETQLYQAILGQFPHFSLQLTKAKDNTAIRSWGPGISFDIPLFNRNQGAIAIAEATREQLYKEYLARLNQTRSDIASIVADLRLINEEEFILKTELREVQATEKLITEGLKEGDLNLITYESILTSLVSNELKLLALQQDRAEQIIALQIAQGTYWD